MRVARGWIGATLAVVAWWPLGSPACAAAAPTRPTTTTTVPGSVTTGSTTTTVPATPATTTTTAQAVQLNAADTGYLDGVSARLHAAESSLAAAEVAQRAARSSVAATTASVTSATKAVSSLTADERTAIAQVRAARDRLRDLAVSSYMAGGPVSPISALLGSHSVDELRQRQALVTTVAKADRSALRRYDTARRRASTRALKALDALRSAQDAAHLANQAAATASDLVARRAADLSDTAKLLQLVTAAVGYPGTDIPRLVLDAYRRGAATVQKSGCLLPWSALAAIGKVESDHGRAQGARITMAGDLVPAITGPVLDGQNGTQQVLDTDHGRWDGDLVSRYETAVGPMQFLPSTWAVAGRDANGDGVADPNNIYDAALTAAVYLCRDAAPDQLNTDPALRQALFAYNHSNAYVDEVLALAHVYGSVSLSG